MHIMTYLPKFFCGIENFELVTMWLIYSEIYSCDTFFLNFFVLWHKKALICVNVIYLSQIYFLWHQNFYLRHTFILLQDFFFLFYFFPSSFVFAAALATVLTVAKPKKKMNEEVRIKKGNKNEKRKHTMSWHFCHVSAASTLFSFCCPCKRTHKVFSGVH